MNMLLFLGALGFLVLFVWYLSAVERSIRLKAGLALWLVGLAVCGLAVWPPKETVRLGLDLKGGTSYLVELAGEPSASGLEQAVEVIRKRVDKFGLAEPVIQPSGERRIIVQVPGLKESDKAAVRNQLSRVANLEFRLVHEANEAEVAKVLAGEAPPLGFELKEIKETRNGQERVERVLVRRRAEMGGKYVARAFWNVDGMGQPLVLLEFSGEGKEIFARLTEANVGRRLAIVLDGEVKSAPRIQNVIAGGTAEITGQFTPQEAEELASVLENPLDTPVAIIEERGVDPSLGRDSIRSGLVAGAIGTLAVVLFMALYYRALGVVAVFGLAANMVVLFGLLAQFHFTLTLPGIAGIILTVGMAVDASVLVFERVREELAAGKPAGAAVQGGFEKAFSSILDANVTTIITAVILFWQGAGPVQGFAVTLVLGILGTLFASLIVNRNLLEWMDAKGWLRRLTMAELFRRPNLDFLRWRRAAAWASLVAVGIGMAAFVSKGERVYSVDFTGGEAVTLAFAKREPVGKLRDALAAAGVADATLQYQKSPDGQSESLFVRTKFGQGEAAEQALRSAFPESGFERKSLDKVGPLVGGELKTKSLIALVAGLGGILVYVAWRFEFSFAVGAILALLHDVLLTVGVFALLAPAREISLTVVGAVLAIAGYSINDTIVVFDRVRESMRGSEKGSLAEIMNRALNLTLSRTLLTAGTTLLSVLALYLFGGPVINGFAFALLIGITAGTYSSIYIACPIVLWWTGGRDEWLRRSLAAEAERKAAAAVPA